MTNWGEQEPSTNPDNQCVVNKDSQHGSSWVTDSCSNQYPSLCRWTSGEFINVVMLVGMECLEYVSNVESIPPTPGTVEGNCPDDDWQEYGGFCYKAHPSEGDELRLEK